MKPHNRIIPALFILLLVAGCASTKITDRDQVVTGPLPRPNTIWVYDFAATPNDVPSESVLSAASNAQIGRAHV